MRKFNITVRHGDIRLGWDYERLFEVQAKDIVDAQKRVLNRVMGITNSSLFYISKAEEIKDE